MDCTCGIDIIEIDRIKNSIENYGESFLNKIYTAKEQDYCNKYGENKYEHYAARFAAKEAVYKAMSNIKELSWKDIEITNQENGRPVVTLYQDIDNLDNIDISLSHCRDYATSYVIAHFKK